MGSILKITACCEAIYERMHRRYHKISVHRIMEGEPKSLECEISHPEVICDRPPDALLFLERYFSQITFTDPILSNY